MVGSACLSDEDWEQEAWVDPYADTLEIGDDT